METKKQILIVDDEPDFLEMFRFILENAGYGITTANSPEEGLEKAKKNPDLILLDLKMPRMTGHEVCRCLKENTDTMNIPVVILTCETGILDKVQAFNLGALDFINKGAPIEELLARIKSILKRTTVILGNLSESEKNEKIMQLAKIIEEKNIRTVFQPIVTLASRQPIGYEALARGPKGTFFENPLNLFALATEANMSYQLDTLCLDLAVKRANSYIKQKLLFLNIDPNVVSSDYLQKLEFLKGTTVPASQICLEITERTFVTNFEKLAKNLNNLKPMGVMIVIDDLGEGYSSLRAIVELKPNFIKADMSLVRDINSDLVKQSLMKVICELAQRTNATLIAEGIETEKEFDTLVSLGVQFGQGYLFARPSEFT
ncbi:MAG: EAL domain-containing protein [Candidatus Omnitrophica bacterium]|nr:EAL domain-containing protein [Candidatus Omnitrophota bacterium]